MGCSKYGQPIRKKQEETPEEERKRALVFKLSPSDSDPDEGDEVEGGEDGEDEDEAQVLCDSNWWIPSPLTPLKGKAVTPKVDDDRVAYAKGTNKGDTSDMSTGELLLLAKHFPWPEGVELRLPCVDGGALAKYPGCIVVYEEALKVGFRLPLHPFIRDFLSIRKFCPAQLSPNSWRCILAFLLKFKELNLVPSYEAFKPFYSAPSKKSIYGVHFPYINLISNPASPRFWGKNWFLVCQTEAFHFNFPMYPGDHRWCNGYTTRNNTETKYQVEEFRKTLHGLKPTYKNVINARRLEEAGLSLPHPVIGPYISETYINKRKREVSGPRSLVKKREALSKRAKKCRSPRKDLASTNRQEKPMVACSVSSTRVERENVCIALEEEPEEEEEEQEEEDPEEEEEEQEEEDTEEEEEEQEEEDPEEEENAGIAQEEEEEKVEEEEPTFAGPLEKPTWPALVSSTLLHGEKEVSQEGGINVPSEGGEFPSFPPGFGGTSSIGTSCCPEMSTALSRLLPEIILAAQNLEAIKRQLNESRQENLELKREKAELECQLVEKDRDFQSRMERMEQDKKAVEEKLIETQSKLVQTAQKAKELFDMSSPLVMKH